MGRKGNRKRGSGYKSSPARSSVKFESYYRRNLAPLLEGYPASFAWGTAVGDAASLREEDKEASAAAAAAVPLGGRAEEGWAALVHALRTPLPCSWRVFGGSPVRERLQRQLSTEMQFEGEELEVEGLKVQPPKPISWYPGGIGWQVDVSRGDMRKSPQLKQIHKFLVKYTGTGDVWRQETVSMIPALLLDVKRHHKVLDMCAAPGSKTAQLVELLHAEDATHGMPTGCVVANDSNTQRCYMLVHMMKRLGSPCLLAVTHDASAFPNLLTLEDGGGPGSGIGWFDRVLADVPCSGDGTIRKTPDLWSQWHAGHGLHLHNIQLRIAMKGIAQLRVGGRMVYSTCSMNPIENEAVVARLLKASNGSVRVVDASDQLPGLKRAPGLTTWSIMSAKGHWVDPEIDLSEKTPQSKGVLRDMFPPTDPEILEQLPRCMRLVPTEHNTGAFFVCVIEKLKPWTTPKTAEAAKPSSADMEVDGGDDEKEETEDAPPEAKKPRKDPADTETAGSGGGAGGAAERPGLRKSKPKVHANDEVRPYDFVPIEDDRWEPLKAQYDIVDDAPRAGLFLRKSTVNTVTWLCPSIAELFLTKQAAALNVVHTGLRMFMKDKTTTGKTEGDDVCYRLCQEALPVLKTSLPAERVMHVGLRDFALLLHTVGHGLIGFRRFEEATCKKILAQKPGSVVFALNDESLAIVRRQAGEDDAPGADKRVLAGMQMAICGWRGDYAISAYVTKEDTTVYLERLPADIVAETLAAINTDTKPATEGAEVADA